MTYGRPLPDEIRLTAIDESNIDLHVRLTAEDKCYFLFEYTSGQGYDFSATNNLISNLKKKPGAKGQYYKDQAIGRCAAVLRQTLNSDWLAGATLVPVPPSKATDHPDHDRRMERICRAIQPGLDVRLLVRQTLSTAAAHEAGAGERPSVEDLLAIYEIDETLTQPAPAAIGIFDDVLTAGTHYRAMETVLRNRFPQVPIFGFFIARRVFPTSSFDEWFG
jgi:hypothetical protein